MKLPIRFLPEAQEEFDRAYDWYDDLASDLGDDFMARVERAIHRVSVNPKMHGVVHRDVRKAVIGRFPYIVLYREHAGELIVVAVFHTSRDPEEWKSRVE